MSLLNQPSRLLLTSDDLEWGTGQNFNLTLPEAIVGAKGVDCARAVIPTTQYPIPDYQNKFYYQIEGIPYTLTLTNGRNFSTIADLITQLNADAISQDVPLTFSYDTTTNRITVNFANIPDYPHIVVNNTNNAIATSGYVGFTSIPLVNGVYTPTAFATMVGTAFENAIKALPTFETTTCVGTVSSNKLVLTFTNITGFQGFINPQSVAVNTLLGYSTTSALSIDSNNPFTFNPGPLNILPPATASVVPRSAWTTKFALNTRLGFPYTGITAVSTAPGIASAVGTFLPNLLRTRVIYITCNISTNDSISTDGLRSVLAKIPVNSQYGGMTIYEPPDFNFCRIVQSSYQNIQVALLDENYEPYQLMIEEPTELEFVFIYETPHNEF